MNKCIALSMLMFSLMISCSQDSATETKTPTQIIDKTIAPSTIEWTDLMPEADLKILESMTPIDHDTLSKEELDKDNATTQNSLKTNTAISQLEDSVTAAIVDANKSQNRTYKDALNSYEVRPEYNNKDIKIAGYVVPIDYNDKSIVTSFFLVPYFGACIHVPPPPPNQIIYVRIPKGIKITDIYNPFWVTGSLRVETTEKENGASAYSLDAESVTAYTEE